MSRKKVQAYAEDFCREAVRRSEQEGNSARKVAEELGISAQQIYNWKRQFTRLSDKQFNTMDGVDYSKNESEEVRKLRRENKKLKEEVDFLKKPQRISPTARSEIRHDKRTQKAIFYHLNVPYARCIQIWLLQMDSLDTR